MRRQCVQLALFSLILLCSNSAEAAQFHCNDVTCLINAIVASNSNGEANTINLWPGTYSLTTMNHTGPVTISTGAVAVPVNFGLPAITGTMVIRSIDAGKTLMSSPSLGLFDVTSTGNLTLDRVSLTAGGPASGMAINNKNGNVSLFRGRITNTRSFVINNVVNDGGTFVIDKSTISDNFSDAASFFIRGGLVRISDSVIAGNSGVHGGAMLIAGGSLFITRSTFSKNIGDSSAFFASGPAFTTITESAFTQNTGVFLPIQNSGVMFVTNTTIAGNGTLPPGTTSGISNTGSLWINNSTIVDNTAGLPFAAGVQGNTTTFIQNSIVARNQRSNCGGPIRSLGNNIFDDLTCSPLPTDIIGDPGLGAFQDDGTAGNGHYPLQWFSRGINAGNNAACPADDQLGRKRVGRCDIGAVAAAFGFGPFF